MKKYPELDIIADIVADITCNIINRLTRDAISEMPYKGQYVLEMLIEKLQDKI